MIFNGLKSRRDFLRLGCRTISTLGAAAAFGQAGLLSAAVPVGVSDYKALVCIFLFGGNDANNMLIPNDSGNDTQYGYANYSKVRGNLALSQASLNPIQAFGGHAFGLHPSMKPLADLYNDTAKSGTKRVALVANVGTLVQPVPRTGPNGTPNFNNILLPVNLYSHSDQQTEWQNGVPQGGATTGWAGRLADRIYVPGCSQSATGGYTDFPPNVGISGNALELQGYCAPQSTVSTSNFGLTGDDGSAVGNGRVDGLTQMLSLSSGVTLIQAAQTTLSNAIGIAKEINSATGQTPITGFPTTDIGNQLAQVASLIQLQSKLGVNRQIFFVTQGGYDTHSDEVKQQGGLLSDLANAMVAFDAALGTLGVQNKVTTFTQSEFNRTFQPNGNAGTDHAWGTHTIVMGGAVKGGQVFGAFPHLVLQGPDDSGNRGNWVPTTAVDQYGAGLAKWFGLSAQADFDYVFPNLKNFNYANLPIFG